MIKIADGTYIELTGTFKFAINQNGLDYDNEEEREHAVDDFMECWEEFLENIGHHNHIPDFSYNEDDMKISKGE